MSTPMELDDGGEEDEVSAEYEVRLNKNSSDVYLVQFPLRSDDSALKDVVDGRVRPKQRRLELVSKLIPQNAEKSFDRERLRAHGENPRQRLVGAASPVGHVANHFAARFDGSTLSLVPIDAIVQMRPDFTHVDTFGAETQMKDGKDDQVKMDTDHGEMTAGEESGVEAIDVKFRRRETEKAEERRKKSHAYLVKRREEENWINLKVVLSPDPACAAARERMFVGIKSEMGNKVRFSGREEYIKMLSPMSASPIRIHSRHSIMDTFLGPLSRREIQALPLTGAVEEIIKRVRIISFSTVLSMLGAPLAEKDVFKILEKHAFLLRGNWVALKPATKDQNVVDLAAREIILHMFWSQESVTVKEAQVATYNFLPDQLIEEILLDVGERSKGIGWRLRLDDDNSVIERFSAELETHRREHEERVGRATALLRKKCSA